MPGDDLDVVAPDPLLASSEGDEAALMADRDGARQSPSQLARTKTATPAAVWAYSSRLQRIESPCDTSHFD
jgi:hypothetical protein